MKNSHNPRILQEPLDVIEDASTLVKRFKAKLGSDAGPIFIEVPFNIKRDFGMARPPVTVSINGYSYQSTISVYGGKYYVPVRKDRRAGAGVRVGEIVEVIVAPDTSVRIVKTPKDLATALAKTVGTRAEWKKLSYSHKKEHVAGLLESKTRETRARRIKRIIEMLMNKRNQHE